MYTIYSLDYQNPYEMPAVDCRQNLKGRKHFRDPREQAQDPPEALKEEEQPADDDDGEDAENAEAAPTQHQAAYNAIICENSEEYRQLMEFLNATEWTTLGAMGRLLQPRLITAPRTAAQEALFNKLLKAWEFHCLPHVTSDADAAAQAAAAAEREQQKPPLPKPPKLTPMPKYEPPPGALGLNDLCCRKVRERFMRYHRVPVYYKTEPTECTCCGQLY